MKTCLPILVAMAVSCAVAESMLLPTAGLHSPRQPQVAVDAQGMVHAVFGDGTKIFSASAGGDGLVFEARVKVAELPKLALGMRRGPRIAVVADGLVVTAISHEDGMIHSWRSSDSGRTWRETAAINTVQNSAREGLHALASDGRGLIVCVWLDLRGGGAEVWSRVARDGGATWEAEARVYGSPDGHVCQCCVPSVAIGPRGEIAVMWRNALAGARDMWMATSSDGGRSYPAPRKLGEGTWMLSQCPMDGGGIAFAPDGAPRTVWRRNDVVFTSALKGPEVRLAEDAIQPLVVSNSAGVAAFWEHGDALWVRVGNESARVLASPARMASAAGCGPDFIAVWEEPHGHLLRLLAERFR